MRLMILQQVISLALFFAGCVHADVYAVRQNNVTYFSDSYSPGSKKVQNDTAGGVTVITNANQLNTNVNYPAATPPIQPSIQLIGIQNGSTINEKTPLSISVVVPTNLSNVTATLFLDGVAQQIPPTGTVLLSHLPDGHHTVYAQLSDAANPVLAQSQHYAFTVFSEMTSNEMTEKNKEAELTKPHKLSNASPSDVELLSEKPENSK